MSDSKYQRERHCWCVLCTHNVWSFSTSSGFQVVKKVLNHIFLNPLYYIQCTVYSSFCSKTKPYHKQCINSGFIYCSTGQEAVVWEPFSVLLSCMCTDHGSFVNDWIVTTLRYFWRGDLRWRQLFVFSANTPNTVNTWITDRWW